MKKMITLVCCAFLAIMCMPLAACSFEDIKNTVVGWHDSIVDSWLDKESEPDEPEEPDEPDEPQTANLSGASLECTCNGSTVLKFDNYGKYADQTIAYPESLTDVYIFNNIVVNFIYDGEGDHKAYNVTGITLTTSAEEFKTEDGLYMPIFTFTEGEEVRADIPWDMANDIWGDASWQDPAQLAELDANLVIVLHIKSEDGETIDFSYFADVDYTNVA